jgi:NitT/TauT family transport system substrate-binding protein
MLTRAIKSFAVAALALGLGSASAAKAEEISVTHWGALMYGGPYAVAMEKGFFKQAGVDITGILTSKGGGTTVRNVLAGGLPYGEVSLAAAVAAAKEGLEIKIVNAGAVSVADILWVTTPDSPIKSVKDLVGKKIAYTSPKSVTDMLSIMVLTKNGIELTKVERISTGSIGAGLTALGQGAVVAAPTMDPIWSRSSDKYRPVFELSKELPSMTQTVGITTVDFINANPAEGGAIFAKAYNLDPALGEKAVRNMLAVGYWGKGDIDLAAMDRMVEGLRIIGEVDGKVDWSKLVDTSFLPADLRKPS